MTSHLIWQFRVFREFSANIFFQTFEKCSWADSLLVEPWVVNILCSRCLTEPRHITMVRTGVVSLTRALTHYSWRPSTSPEAIRVHTRRRLHIRLQPGLHDPGGEWTGGQEGNVPRSSSLSYRCRGPSQWPGPGETARTVIRHDGTDGLQSRERAERLRHVKNNFGM